MEIDINLIREFFKNYKRQVCEDSNLQKAAVLIPLLEKNNDLYIVLTERTYRVQHHKGQISFPGGNKEMADVNLIDTALRETDEEIGIKRENIEILGVLSDFNTASGFCITPVVGLLKNVNKFLINKIEVSNVLEVPISYFIDYGNRKVELYENGRIVRESYAYYYNSNKIWGITAKIIVSFLDDLKVFKKGNI